MKKLFLAAVLFIATATTSHAQLVKLGIKAGANFSNFNSAASFSGATNYHFGAVAEIKALPMLKIQPELMYSTAGAEASIGAVRKVNFSYFTVPVMAKFSVIPGIVSLDAGPQFAFLANKNVDEIRDTKSFDLALCGGATVNITSSLFGQVRYVAGLTKAATINNIDVKNTGVQLSVGYFF